jgi:hypothetical protein
VSLFASICRRGFFQAKELAKTFALLARDFFSTTSVEKACGNDVFAADKFLHLLDF